MADQIDENAELEQLLGGGKSEEGEGEGTAAPDFSKLLLPTTDDVPAELRGKPLTEGLKLVADMQSKLTKVLQEKADLVRTLEQAGAGGAGKPDTGTGGAPALTEMDVIANTVLEQKLDLTITQSPELAPYKGEIMALLSGVTDPRVRLNSQALSTAISHVRGVHFQELAEALVAKARGSAPVVVAGDGAGGVPATPPTSLELSKAQQANALAWLGKEGVKSILGGD